MLDFLNAPLPAVKRGGWRQRKAAAAAAKRRRIRSKMAERQLARWCDGHITTPNLVHICRDTIEDGGCQPILFRLGCLTQTKCRSSKFSASMKTPRLRDLMLVLKNDSITKFICKLDGSINSFLKPSELMQYELTNFPSKFKRNFGADRSKLEQFWRGLFQSRIGREMGAMNPMLRNKTPTELNNYIPIVLHEDAGPYAKGYSMNIINFSALLARGPESQTKFAIASHIKTADDKPDEESLSKFWSEVIADFDALANSDKLVAKDESKWRAVLMFGKGDMEMRIQTWGLPGYSHKIDVCPNCLANRNERPYTDNRPNANWRPTSIQTMPNEFFMARLATPRHPLTNSNYFNKYFAVLDVMHVMDCKGVTSHVAGGVLRYLIVNENRLGRNQDLRLADLNRQMEQYQSDEKTKSKMPKFRMDNFVASDGWIQLSGQLIKAANTRHLLPWLVEISNFYFDRETNFDKCIRAMVQHLDEFYQILYSAGTFLTAEEQTKFEACIMKLGIRYQFLREHFKKSNELFFNFVHKVHAMQHLPEVASFINPIMLQCYAEEGAVGRVGQIWKASKHGPYRKRVQEVVLTKALIRWHLRLIGRT